MSDDSARSRSRCKGVTPEIEALSRYWRDVSQSPEKRQLRVYLVENHRNSTASIAFEDAALKAIKEFRSLSRAQQVLILESFDAGLTKGASPEPPPIPVFEFLDMLLPSRLTGEELGDALERIDALRRRGAAKWKIRLKIASTAFWLGINALREVSSAILGKARNS